MKSGPSIFETSEQDPQWTSQTREAEEGTTHYSFFHSADSFVLRSPYENPLWIRRQLKRNAEENARNNLQTVTFKPHKP